ncbi:MFS domain-containing protein [Meloidogyne graminicola]|uniref:MFS domain-containing protein n=1 Tax=Meloidogyne graminicola TaxID=189291 RepID=A0A8S9ZXN5_9BILA|nr:MFS domain-containing protein [Meloidogyne graminicola]
MLAMAIGNLISIFPFIYFYSKFGPRLVLFFASLISGIFTALTPLAKFYGFWTFLVVRIIQGITYAADFSALGILCTQWAPLEEYGLFLSLISSYSPASIFIICSSSFLNWHFIYYISSIFVLIFSFIWLLIYKELPQLSSQVTIKELKKIQKGKNNLHINKKINEQKIPLNKILMSKIIWICWLNSFAEIIPGIFIIQYKPQYFNYILKYNIFNTGWLTALPSFLHIPLKLLFGLASDKISFISEKNKLILFNNISVGLPILSYIAIIFAPNSIFSLFGFISASIFYSASCGGFYKCSILTSRQFKNKLEWNNIFILFSITSFLANILFCIFATDKPEKFTQNE